MNLVSDWYVKGTVSHPLCEDYIAQEDNIIVLSDGCSSSTKTDVGARILSHTFLQGLIRKDIPYNNTYGYNVFRSIDILRKADRITQELSLPIECLDCTINSIYNLQNENYIRHFIIGDGVVFARDKHNELTVFLFEYEHNAPNYFNYMNSDREKQYVEFSKGKKYIIKKITKDSTETLYQGDIIDEYNRFFYLDDYYLVGVASDGITQLIKNGQPLDIYNSIDKLTSFKNINGEFLKRRCIRQFSDWEKDNVHNFDDFSIAVIMDKEYFNADTKTT